MSVPTALPPKVRDLVTPDQFTSLGRTVLDGNPDMAEETAGRIVEEGLKFVVACAAFPDARLAPSRVVDEGWHALILHTGLYADLGERLGKFVHHHPGWNPTHYDPEILERTRAMIGECGYAPDPELWGHPTENVLVSVAANCQHAPECTIIPMPPDPGPTG